MEPFPNGSKSLQSTVACSSSPTDSPKNATLYSRKCLILNVNMDQHVILIFRILAVLILLRILIDLVPQGFDPCPFLLRSLSVLCLSLKAFCAQASIDILFRPVASTKELDHEAPCVALVENCHDLLATCEWLMNEQTCYRTVQMRRTSIVFGMKVRMHDTNQSLHTPHITTKTDDEKIQPVRICASTMKGHPKLLRGTKQRVAQHLAEAWHWRTHDCRIVAHPCSESRT